MLTSGPRRFWRCRTRSGARGDPVERVTDDVQIFAAGIGDNQSLALAIEKLDPERRLERLT